ncbi:MAG: replication initiator protein A [Armatimonadetes bacterium]|nr:replication initiator protein A [Armatimonadota bacterium]
MNEVVTTLPAGTGHDHATLALLPFSVTSQSGDGRAAPVTVAYQAEVDGKIRRVNVTLRPGAGVMLPTPGDQMVFLALLQLALDRDPPAARLEFHRREVIAKLGWSDGGRNFDRLREALERLTALTITGSAALVSRTGSQYAREEEASHVIERYRIGNREGRPCVVEWGHLVKEAFRLGDLKRLDWDLVVALGNPVTCQLYRLLDRVTLTGQGDWSVGWRSLAPALGMGTGYDRPAKFRDKLRPHCDTLIRQGVIESVEYDRGGVFHFRVRNYLRAEIRRILVETFGVLDEAVIMTQCDCLQHGSRPRPKSRGGYLTEAIRGRYELRYPDNEPLTFTAAVWGLLGAEERHAYHQAGLRLLGTGDTLLDTRSDPTAWSPEMRAVVRFMVAHGIDPEQVVKPPAGLLPVGPPE